MVHTIARACSDGKLLNCRCAAIHKKEQLPDNSKWGGCGDNVKDAKKITRNFLQLKRAGDFLNEVLNYNSEVGINTVSDNDATTCACHGVSGNCKKCFFVRILHKRIASELVRGSCKWKSHDLYNQRWYLYIKS